MLGRRAALFAILLAIRLGNVQAAESAEADLTCMCSCAWGNCVLGRTAMPGLVTSLTDIPFVASPWLQLGEGELTYLGANTPALATVLPGRVRNIFCVRPCLGAVVARTTRCTGPASTLLRAAVFSSRRGRKSTATLGICGMPAGCTQDIHMPRRQREMLESLHSNTPLALKHPHNRGLVVSQPSHRIQASCPLPLPWTASAVPRPHEPGRQARCRRRRASQPTHTATRMAQVTLPWPGVGPR